MAYLPAQGEPRLPQGLDHLPLAVALAAGALQGRRKSVCEVAAASLVPCFLARPRRSMRLIWSRYCCEEMDCHSGTASKLVDRILTMYNT